MQEQDILGQWIAVLFGYFAIMNPIANTAVFVGLTPDGDNRAQIAFKALLLSFIIIVLFAILGQTLFHFFGITLHALRFAGGIMVFIIGYQMLHGDSSSLHQPGDHSHADIAVSPLAVPILAGPGTIATTMNFAGAGGIAPIAITIAGFALMCVITFFCFLIAGRIVKFIGKSGLDIATRLMGLILTIIAAQMFMAGIAGAVESFQSGDGLGQMTRSLFDQLLV